MLLEYWPLCSVHNVLFSIRTNLNSDTWWQSGFYLYFCFANNKGALVCSSICCGFIALPSYALRNSGNLTTALRTHKWVWSVTWNEMITTGMLIRSSYFVAKIAFPLELIWAVSDCFTSFEWIPVSVLQGFSQKDIKMKARWFSVKDGDRLQPGCTQYSFTSKWRYLKTLATLK